MPYRDPEAQREYQRRWKAERRTAWMADKFCERCGSTENLEVHHRDGEEKIDHKVWSWSKERRDTELAKCVVLCRDCHEDEHWPRSMPRSPVLFAEARRREAVEEARRRHVRIPESPQQTASLGQGRRLADSNRCFAPKSVVHVNQPRDLP